MKKVAIFDIDGTVFRSSLLIELTDALIQEGGEKWCQLYFSLSYVHGEKWWGKMVSTLFFFKLCPN